MATSNSTNVNAREALIEFALRRISVAYHRVLICAKHIFQDSACRARWKGVLPKGPERGPPSPHGPFCRDFGKI
jgi:hypothetical protein